MSDHMKEAERLMRQYTTAVLEQNYEAIALYHAALLAHIQRGCYPQAEIMDNNGRGAVPEGWQVVPKEPTDAMRAAVIREQRALMRASNGLQGDGPACDQYRAMLAAAPAPDQFRDAAKMVPAPAEVPMPEPDATLYDDRYYFAHEGLRKADGFHSAGWRFDVIGLHTAKRYGADCRAAGDAAGYARGLAEAGRDAECQRRLFDVLLGEDGQAWKEAERYLETARPDLYVALHGEVKGLASTETECDLPPRGWRCTRGKGHSGPCAAVECPWEVEIVERAMKRLRGESKP